MSASEHSSVLRAHVGLWVAQVAFGLFPLFGKLAFEAFDPAAVAEWRVLFGTIAFLGIAFAVHGRAALPARRDLLRMQCCALLGVGLNQALYLEGLKRTTSIHTGLMMLLVPVFTFLFALLVRQERFSWRRALGILIALGGAAQLVLQRDAGGTASEPLVGNLLLVANTSCYAAYLVASKPLMQRYPPMAMLAWMYALSLWMLPFLHSDSGLFPAGIGAGPWVALAAILFLPTFLAYLLNLYALRFVSASTTAVYVFSQPLIAGVAGVLFLAETLGPGTAIAAGCIFVGIWLVVVRRRR